MGNEEYPDSQRQASKTLEVLLLLSMLIFLNIKVYQFIFFNYKVIHKKFSNSYRSC